MQLFRTSRQGKDLRRSPTLELLEDRYCPSPTTPHDGSPHTPHAAVLVQGSLLTLRGDGAADVITIVDDGSGIVSASIAPPSGSPISGQGSHIRGIKLEAGGGNVQINFSVSNALQGPLSLLFSLGKGNDQVNLDFSAGITGTATTDSKGTTGSGGKDTSPNSSMLNIQLDGGSGQDQITSTFGALSHAGLRLEERLGSGNSHSSTQFNGPISGSLLGVAIDGGTGSQDIAVGFNAISSSKVGVMECLGKGANTTGHVTLGGPITSKAQVSVETDTETSGDAITVQLGDVTDSLVSLMGCLGKSSSSFEADLQGCIHGSSKVSVAGDGKGSDHFTINASGVAVDAGAELNLEAGCGMGSDVTGVTYKGVMKGRLRVAVQGGAGGDTETTSVTLDQGSTGKVGVLESGGAGNDTLTLDVYDNSGGTLSGLSAYLNGRGGQDTISTTPNVKVVH